MKKLLLALFTMGFLSIPTFASINIEDIIGGNTSGSTTSQTAVEIENARTIAISNFFVSTSQIINNYCAELDVINTDWETNTLTWTNYDDKSKRLLFEFILNKIQPMSQTYSNLISTHSTVFIPLKTLDNPDDVYQLINKYKAINTILSSAKTNIDSLTAIIAECDTHIDDNIENIESKQFYTLLKKFCTTLSTTLGNNTKLIARSIAVLEQSTNKLNPNNRDNEVTYTEIKDIADTTWLTINRSFGFIRLGISTINLFVKIQGKSIDPYINNINRENFKKVLDATTEVTRKLKVEFSNVAAVK